MKPAKPASGPQGCPGAGGRGEALPLKAQAYVRVSKPYISSMKAIGIKVLRIYNLIGSLVTLRSFSRQNPEGAATG